MPRLSLDQWESARAKREAGATFDAVATEFGVTKAAVIKRAKADGWSDGSDLAATIRRKVTEKVTGASRGNPEKLVAAVDAAADEGANVLRRHRRETQPLRERIEQALATIERDDVLALKRITETTEIIQRLERRAYALDERADSEIVIPNPRKLEPDE